MGNGAAESSDPPEYDPYESDEPEILEGMYDVLTPWDLSYLEYFGIPTINACKEDTNFTWCTWDRLACLFATTAAHGI